MNPLKHVAIIMDGNGRWGLKYKNSRNAGHKSGLKTVEKIIKETIKNKISIIDFIILSELMALIRCILIVIINLTFLYFSRPSDFA